MAREKKFNLNFQALVDSFNDAVFTRVEKDDDDKDVTVEYKVVGETTIEGEKGNIKASEKAPVVNFSSMDQVLALCGNDTNIVLGILSDAVTTILQRPARAALKVTLDGPVKNVDRLVESGIKAKVYDSVEEGREDVITRMKRKNLLPADWTYPTEKTA
jgi:hypothetical protein